MKNTIKTVLFLVLFFVSGLCSAQMFSVDELLKLSEDNKENFKDAVVENGYTNENIVSNKFSDSYEYSTPSGNSTISLVSPYSETRMLTWSFKVESAYKELNSQLEDSGYKLINTEKRNAGKYMSLYYSRPGFEIILTSDKTVDPVGRYVLSIKTTKATAVPIYIDYSAPEPVKKKTMW